jgi:hypothetical protein
VEAHTRVAAGRCPAACGSCPAQRRTGPGKSSGLLATEAQSSRAVAWGMEMVVCSRRRWMECDTSLLPHPMTACGWIRWAVNNRHSLTRSCRQAWSHTPARQTARQTMARDTGSGGLARSCLSSHRGHHDSAIRLQRFEIPHGHTLSRCGHARSGREPVPAR